MPDGVMNDDQSEQSMLAEWTSYADKRSAQNFPEQQALVNAPMPAPEKK